MRCLVVSEIRYYPPPVGKWAEIIKDHTEDPRYFAYVFNDPDDHGDIHTIEFESVGITLEEVQKDFMKAYTKQQEQEK